MASHNEFGKWGEQYAEDYLRQCGYVILRRNFLHRKAEIDLIAQKGSTLVFIEVKTRHSIHFALPETAIDRKKIACLVRAANAFAEQFEADVSVRFDVITVHKKGEEFVLNHMMDAFYVF